MVSCGARETAHVAVPSQSLFTDFAAVVENEPAYSNKNNFSFFLSYFFMSTSCDPKPFTFLQVGFSYTTRITLYIGRLCMGMQQLSLPYPALHIITTWPGERIPPDPLALVFTSARGGKRAEKGWKHAWTEAIVKPRLAHCVSERVNGMVWY